MAWIPAVAAVGGQLAGAMFGGGGQPDTQYQADLLRTKWNEYMGTFFPEEQKLIGMLSTPQSIEADVNSAVQNAQQSDTAAYQSAQRRLKSFGIPMDSGQEAEMNRQYNEQSGLDQVSAANNERQIIQNRDMQIMAGSRAPAPGGM